MSRKIAQTSISVTGKQFWTKCKNYTLKDGKYWQKDSLRFIKPMAVMTMLDSSESDQSEYNLRKCFCRNELTLFKTTYRVTVKLIFSV